jgi:toxin ParE1/3/4
VSSGSVRIHPAALEEVEAATIWYRQRSHRAAEIFLTELERAIEQIEYGPHRFPTYESGTRRAALRKFPFLIVFRETADGAEIVAVSHGRRRPGYWRDRLD